MAEDIVAVIYPNMPRPTPAVLESVLNSFKLPKSRTGDRRMAFLAGVSLTEMELTSVSEFS
jgi:hypothetical protein